jgi:uncharacterized protein YndB with AHSA1/START domain
MAFSFIDEQHETQGKTTEHADIFHGIPEELITNERIAEAINFESDDPAFHGIMKVITILELVNDGTKVTIRCEQVPGGIKEEDNRKGIQSSLKNLATFTE